MQTVIGTGAFAASTTEYLIEAFTKADSLKGLGKGAAIAGKVLGGREFLRDAAVDAREGNGSREVSALRTAQNAKPMDSSVSVMSAEVASVSREMAAACSAAASVRSFGVTVYGP